MSSRFAIPVLPLFAALLVLVLPGRTAHAQWATNGNALCTASGFQAHPAMCTDGAGGAIVAWDDQRSGPNDIYVQRIDGSGSVLWTADGVALCNAANAQYSAAIISDGDGGAIVVWTDERNGAASDIYAQRIDAAGFVQWAPDGVALCTAAGAQYYAAITTDGSHGAFVTWMDQRNGDWLSDIYAQRIDAQGDVCWSPDGVPLCTAAANQIDPRIIPDGTGGAIVVWTDGREVDIRIYAQRVTGAGAIVWPVDGVGVCPTGSDPWHARITTDGAAGAIVAWVIYFGIFQEKSDIYVQRVSAAGTLLWAPGGVVISDAFYDQTNVEITSDHAGGAILTWMDSGGNGVDIFAQRVDGAGTRLWMPDGVAVCNALNTQGAPCIASDGVGGAIIAWQDNTCAPDCPDVYAGRVNASGSIPWASSGVPVSTATSGQWFPAIVDDGGGGAIVAWEDARDSFYRDIYAQRVGPNGLIPTAVRGHDGTPGLTLYQTVPNPFSSTTTIDLHLASDSNVDARVYDVTGRLVRTLTIGPMNAGRHQVVFDGRDGLGRPLASGVYFCRVAANGIARTQKIVIAR